MTTTGMPGSERWSESHASPDGLISCITSVKPESTITLNADELMNLFSTSMPLFGDEAACILPAFTVALSYISTYIRLIRNNMLENMREDYVLYAQARGLKQRAILVRHILKNSLQSCVTAIGMSIPQLISGTIVVENVFAWPGVGRLCITSIFNRDYPVIQAYVLLVGVLFVFFNLFFDILQYAADPRLRERKD